MRSTPNGRSAGEEDPAGPLTPPPGAATFVAHAYRVTDPRPLEILSTTWTVGLFYTVCLQDECSVAKIQCVAWSELHSCSAKVREATICCILVSHPLPAFFVGAGFSDHY